MTNNFPRIEIILLLITTIILNACNGKLSNETNKSDCQGTKWINFEWAGDPIGNKYFDKVAMFVPVRFEGIPQQFKAQFDLGSAASIIYGNSFKPYLSAYPEYANKLDTINTQISIENKKQGDLKNVALFLDSMKIRLDILPLYKNYGEAIPADSLKSVSAKNIGAIGADVAKNKILIIDYQNKHIAILDSLNPVLNSKFDFVQCKMKEGRFIMPLTVNGKIQWYMFDTGASLFPLVTDGDNWRSFCDTLKTDTVKIGSWGTFYNIYGAKTTRDIFLTKQNFPRRKLT